MGAPLTLGILPPKKLIPGSNANYWQFTDAIQTNVVPLLHPTDPTLPVPKEPHWFIEGVVGEVIHEGDSDVHVWVNYVDANGNATKDRIACEITPQNPLKPPTVGEKVRVYGILRYDWQHSWWEIHGVDWIEPL